MKPLQMPFRCVYPAEEDRVVTPDDAFLPGPAGQLLKYRNHNLLLIRKSRLHILPVGRQSKLEIIRIVFEGRKPVQHGRRIFGPEHNAVHIFRRKTNLADLTRVSRIACQHIAFLQSVFQPF